jgi:transcriptional regulator
MNLKGTLPILILQVLTAGPSHGYQIAQDIKARSKGVLDFREGTLYPALHALEQKQFIVSSERVENGRRRRHYKLTDAGIDLLESERKEWQKLSGAVSTILGDA